jgi:hypothetical protein
MDLSAAYLPESWYKGEGLREIVGLVKGFWNNVVTTANKLFSQWSDFIGKQLKKINIFGVNLGQWFDDDPVGATAGTAAALLSAGVILITGGTVVGMVKGGISKLWKMGKSVVTALGLGGLIRAAVGGVQRIWNFNWQISDKDIRAQQKSTLDSQAGIWGETLGSMVGTLCGFSLGRIAYANQAELVRFNPDLIAKLDELRINNFDEDSELWEEAVENLKAAIASTTRAAINIAGLEAYLNVRKAIKAVARGVNLSSFWPGIGKMVETWGDENQKSWSFASAQEEWIDSLPEGAVKNFTEEFIESAQDMCAESTIQVSYAL